MQVKLTMRSVASHAKELGELSLAAKASLIMAVGLLVALIQGEKRKYAKTLNQREKSHSSELWQATETTPHPDG